MTQMKIVKTVFVKAPPEHVWRFLTEADKLALWFHRGRADLAAGGDYVLESNSYGKDGEKVIWGEIIEMAPYERLVHSFTHQWLKGVETRCTWTLEAFDGGTVVTLVHDGWENVDDDPFGMAANHDSGWDEHMLRLRRVAS
ncbi:MAG: hypothetical protein Tsb0010_02670 [Parvularculaceae bacterium]